MAERRSAGLLRCRMVKHNLDGEGSSDSEGGESSAQSPEDGALVHLRLEKLLQRLEELENQSETHDESWRSHFRPFKSHEEYQLVRSTFRQLQHSGFYWGAISMADAHLALAPEPVGTFLIRDSSQPDVFFTLSYRGDPAPTSVRVLLDGLCFHLSGSTKSFPSLFALLAHYSSAPCKLTVPLRHQRPESLKQLSRRALVRAFGAGALRTFAGLSEELRDYIGVYPHPI